MENKKTKIISMIAIIALVLTVITATYAYFQAQTGEGSQTDVKITANTVDTLTFETGSAISLSLDQENFAKGTGNQTGSTFAKAMLTANNKTNSATEHYYLYLNISSNTFSYTQGTDKPEILLTIKDESNNEITSISGLTYKTITDASGASISGFDITIKNGLITIIDNRVITTTSSKTEQWNVTVTFVNYDADQSANAGKNFSAKLMIQKNQVTLPLHISCNDNTLACHVAKLYTGTQGKNNIYYHDGTLEYGIDDGSYRFAGPSEQVNNFICFGSITSPCPTDNLYRIIELIDGKVKLIKYDYMTTDELGIDGDYSKNYKNRGMDDSYKGTYGDGEKIGIYYWNRNADTSNSNNTWSTSLFNKTNLNTNFINYIGEEWANKIAMTTWKVGGNTWSNIGSAIPSVAYQNEITNPDSTNSTDNATEYQAKIGLMYVSDYGFAASPSAWTLTMGSYNNTTATNNNWMYMGLNEWTITRILTDSLNVFLVDSLGVLSGYEVDSDFVAVRAVFNLVPSVTYKSGTGTMSDPILIN